MPEPVLYVGEPGDGGTLNMFADDGVNLVGFSLKPLEGFSLVGYTPVWGVFRKKRKSPLFSMSLVPRYENEEKPSSLTMGVLDRKSEALVSGVFDYRFFIVGLLTGKPQEVEVDGKLIRVDFCSP